MDIIAESIIHPIGDPIAVLVGYPPSQPRGVGHL